MTIRAPLLDGRKARDIFDEVVGRLEEGGDLSLGLNRGDPMATALIRIFARYCELVIERLNRVPDKQYLAFLDSLGVTPVPPSAASAALTFRPVTRLPRNGNLVVPARTRVAAPSGESENGPTVFETEYPVRLTNAQLLRVIARDLGRDRYTDRSRLATTDGDSTDAVFEHERPVPHELYIAQEEVFDAEGATHIDLEIEVADDAAGTDRRLQWQLAGTEPPVVLEPLRDTTRGLTRSGSLRFAAPVEWPLTTILGEPAHWLRCRLMACADGAQARKGPLGPGILALRLRAAWEVEALGVAAAYFNGMPLDTTKDFYPLGERPRFGDVWYLACEAFVVPRAKVALGITLTNPSSAGKKSPLPPVSRQAEPVVQWEYWNGARWAALECRDGTRALTDDGVVSFAVPEDTCPAELFGQPGAWIRVRLIGGYYGEEAHLEPGGGIELRHAPATLTPPSVQSVSVRLSGRGDPRSPDAIVTSNDLSLKRVDPAAGTFAPFERLEVGPPTLYLGLSAVDHELDLYIETGGLPGRSFVAASPGAAAVLEAEHWDGREWVRSRVEDRTQALTRSGALRLGFGGNASKWRKSAVDPELHWLRLRCSNEASERPIITRIALNTVAARQMQTIETEILGSSNGAPNQAFRPAHVPVIETLALEVGEPDLPSDDGPDLAAAVTVVETAAGGARSVRVLWKEVAHLLLSGPDDRHFTVDRQRGSIRFGDGVNGMIPPAGTNNLYLSYRSGGGAGGNKAAGTITQLRTAVPYATGVTNFRAAIGGRDIESMEALLERGSRLLRHRDRAVTREDFEDLARLASPAVARARCYPLRDLAADPAGSRRLPGVVSVVIVPRTSAACPKPDLPLLRHVQRFLDERRSADAKLVLVAPEYVEATIEAAIVAAPEAEAGQLVRDCRRLLESVLHPVSGGLDGTPWQFGELPRKAELYRLLESVPGLAYVHSLGVRFREERPGLSASGNFLVCSGEHDLRLTFG